MAIDKKLLKRLKALYVEDDTNIRNELSALLSNFFGKVYTAEDGKNGLETFVKYKDDIDVVLSDINMPQMNGIDMMKKIREIDSKIPVMFATAYSDNEFLAEAIKIKVYDYIIKPIDIRNLLSVMNDLSNILYQEFLIEQQHKELEKYKDVIDSNNIVIKTDITKKITYVNQHFCDITGYEKEELISKDFITIKHPDTDASIYTDMFSNILDNKAYQGRIKQITKFGDPLVVDVYMIPTINDAGDITGSISVQRDITSELNQRRDVQIALMKDKGEIFLKGKESIAELNGIIKELNNRVHDLQKVLKQSELEKDRIILATEKHTVENKRLKTELKQYKKNSEMVEDKSVMTLKLNKENADLKQEIKRLRFEIQKLSENSDKNFMQERVNFEVKIDDLEKELAECQQRLESIGDAESFAEKLNYWKQKARDESKRADELQSQIMQYGDKGIMKKLFGGKV